MEPGQEVAVASAEQVLVALENAAYEWLFDKADW
jgi:hypothetical protein